MYVGINFPLKNIKNSFYSNLFVVFTILFVTNVPKRKCSFTLREIALKYILFIYLCI